MNTVDDGGPAFPHLSPNFDGNWDKEPQRGGMSLRDYAAIHAMSGFLASNVKDETIKPQGLAMVSYAVADAMLAERAKR